ncbi:MAG: hypothetical protein ACKESB_02015 [Candidatus Hodgkinia cicadicola]
MVGRRETHTCVICVLLPQLEACCYAVMAAGNCRCSCGQRSASNVGGGYRCGGGGLVLAFLG